MNIPAEKQQTLRLRESPISQLLFRFSFPAIMAMLVLALYNMVDRIFIGNYPPDGSQRSGGHCRIVSVPAGASGIRTADRRRRRPSDPPG